MPLPVRVSIHKQATFWSLTERSTTVIELCCSLKMALSKGAPLLQRGHSSPGNYYKMTTITWQGFPLNYINRQTQQFLVKKQSKITKQTRKTIQSEFLWNFHTQKRWTAIYQKKLSFFFKLDFTAKFILINKTFNLKRLFTFKEKQYQNKLRRPSVFCRITCSCKSTYIAQTSRNLITRLKNHDPTSPNRQNTDVSKHLTDNPNHKIAFDQTEMTAHTNHGRKLLITETLLIQKHDLKLNVDRTSIPLYFLTCEWYE